MGILDQRSQPGKPELATKDRASGELESPGNEAIPIFASMVRAIANQDYSTARASARRLKALRFSVVWLGPARGGTQ